MASGPTTSWEIDGETVETVSDFILGGSKITADGDCSHEIKRHLLLGRKSMTNLESILKNRDIILPTKVPLVKAMLFPVVMCRCESWTIKMAVKVKAKIAQSCPTLYNLVDYSISGLPVHHQLPSLLKRMPIKLVMPSNQLSSPSPPAFLLPFPGSGSF